MRFENNYKLKGFNRDYWQQVSALLVKVGRPLVVNAQYTLGQVHFFLTPATYVSIQTSWALLRLGKYFMTNPSIIAVKAAMAKKGIEAIFFPPNMTAVLQPLDVTLNKMYKARLRFLLLLWQMEHFDVETNIMKGKNKQKKLES